jgi:periplasmic divalent cation tolerance protein
MTTAGNQEEADRLAGALVEQRLAACVQIIGINSCYVWDGQVQKEPELLLLIKTQSERYEQIERFITENHSYDVPEIVQLPISRGLGGYLSWIQEHTT